MYATSVMLLHCISVIQSDLGPLRIKTIKVTTDFYNYIAAKYKDNKFIYENNQGNTLSYWTGIPFVVDDTIEDEYYVVEFEE